MIRNCLTNSFSSLAAIANEPKGRFWMVLDDQHYARIGLVRFVIEKLKGLVGGYFGPDRTAKEALKYTFIQIAADASSQGFTPDIATITKAAQRIGLVQQPDEIEKSNDDFAALIQSIARQAIASSAQALNEKIAAYYQRHQAALCQIFSPPANIYTLAKRRFSDEDSRQESNTDSETQSQLDLSAGENSAQREPAATVDLPDQQKPKAVDNGPNRPNGHDGSSGQDATVSTSSLSSTIPTTATDLKHAFTELCAELHAWRHATLNAPKPPIEPTSWLGALYDTAARWMAHCTPQSVQSALASLSSWLLDDFISIPEKDARDQRVFAQQGAAVLEAYDRLKSLETQAKKLQLTPKTFYGQDFTSLKAWLKPIYLKADFLNDYFTHLDRLESAYEGANQQELSLLEGTLDFSPQSYVALMRELAANAILADHHRHAAAGLPHNQRAMQEIGKRCAYWQTWGMSQIDALMEPLTAELESECLESLQQLETALNQAQTADPASREAHLQNYDDSLHCLRANLDSCRQLTGALSALLQETGTSADCQRRIRHDLAQIQSIQRTSELQLAALPLLARTPHPIAKTMAEIRAERQHMLSAAKQRRLWKQRSFRQLATPFSEGTTRFLRFFFAYLQLSAPLFQAAMTPIGQRDYQFYLKMMAKASQTGQAVPAEESYDHYLAMAQGFVGTDDEFLTGYDQFLRGQRQVEYQPVQTNTPGDPRLLTPGHQGLLAQAYQATESYLPQDVAGWLHTFLGLNAADRALGNAHAWDNWAKEHLMPQARAHFFEGLGQRFETMDAKLMAAAEEQFAGQRHVPTGYAYYKMYLELKEASAEGSASYRHYRQMVASQPAHQPLLHAFETYFKEHPPAQKTGIDERLCAAPAWDLAAHALVPHHNWQQIQQLCTSTSFSEKLIGSSMKAQAQFAQAWPENLSPLFKPFWQGEAAGSIDENISQIYDNAHVWALQRLGQLQHELPPFELAVGALANNLAMPAEVQRQAAAIQQQISQTSRTLAKLRAHLTQRESSLAELEIDLKQIDACAKHLLSLKESDRQLRQDHLALQQLQAFIEKSAFPMDHKLLLHLAGDFFGEQTELEGINQAIPLEHMHAVVQSLHKMHTAEQPFGKLLAQLAQALKIHQLIEAGDTDALANQLTGTLAALKPGDSVFFPGGWTGSPGHAMYYEFIADHQGKYSLRVYNTGSGIDRYHAGLAANYKSQYLTFTENVDIPLPHITRPECLQALIELSKLPPTGKKKWQATDIYETLLTAFGGQPSPHIYTSDDIRTPQRAGTCSMMSLNTVLRDKMPSPALARKLHWQIVLKGVLDYSSQFEQVLSRSELSRRLLSKSLEETARITKAAFEENAISSLELAYAAEKIEGLHRQLIQVEKDYLAATSTAAPILEPERILDHSKIDLGMIDNWPINPETAPAPPNDIPYHFLQLENWVPSTNAIAGDLQSFYNQLELAINENDPAAVVRDFDRLLRRLPLATPHENLWSSLPDTQKLTVISFLSQSARLAYKALRKNASAHPTQSRLVEPRLLAAFSKATHLALQLLAQTDSNDKFPSEGFAGSDEIITPYLRTYEPAVDETLANRRSYPYLSINSYFPLMRSTEDQPGYMWDNISPPFMQWASDYISRPAIAQKLQAYCADFNSFPVEMQLAFAMSDQYEHAAVQVEIPREIFPAHFYELRDMHTIQEALKQVPLTLMPSTTDASCDFRYYGKTANSQAESYASLEDFNQPNEFDYSRESHDFSHGIFDWSHLQNAHRQIENEDLKRLYITPEHKNSYTGIDSYRGANHPGLRRSSENDNMVETFKDVNFNLQTQRALLKLVSHPPSQVKETLSYFTSHAQLLEDADYQTLFKVLMFDETLLLDELRSAEQRRLSFVNHLAHFTAKHYRFYADIGHFETAVFFLHLNALFYHYVNHVEEGKGPHAKVFMDTRREIRELLTLPEIPLHLRGLFAQELTLCYRSQTSLTVEEAEEFLKAAFYAKVIGPNSKYTAKENELAAEYIFSSLSNVLKDHLEGPNGDHLLNGVVEALTGTPLAASWLPNPAFPYFATKDGLYLLDVRDRTIRTASGAITTLPKEAAHHPFLERILHGRLPTMVEQTHPGIYQFAIDQENYRVIISGQDIRIQKTFALDAAHSAPLNDFAKNYIMIENGVRIHPFIPDGRPAWYEYIPTEKMSRSFYHSGLQEHLFHWIPIDQPGIVVITDIDKLQPLYCALLAFSKVKHIIRLDQQGNLSNLLLDDFKSTAFDFLERFEDGGYTFVWRDKGYRAPVLIEFPRFGKTGLQFAAKKSDAQTVYESTDYPGFVLAKVQDVPALKDFPNYLLLVNGAGQQKVLIPRQALKKQENTSSLETLKSHPKRLLHEVFLKRQQIVSYRIDKQGYLVPESEEARLHLAMIYLWKMAYASANAYLRGTDSSLRQLNDKEKTILYEIACLKDANGDHDPRGLSLNLYASHLLLRDMQNYGHLFSHAELTEMEDLNQYLTPTYLAYLNQLSNIPLDTLKVEEELAILEFVLSRDMKALIAGDIDKMSIEPLLNRLRSLSPLKYQQQLAYLAHTAIMRDFWDIDKPAKPAPPVPLAAVALPKQPIGSFTFENFLFIHEKSPAALLRPSICQHVETGYKLARGELAGQEALDAYHQLTGIKRHSYAPSDFKFALEMMLPAADQHEAFGLLLFEAVMQHPDKFPSSEEFGKNIKIAREEPYRSTIENKCIWDARRFLREKILPPVKAYAAQKKAAYAALNPAPATLRAFDIDISEKETPATSPYDLLNPLYQFSIQPQAAPLQPPLIHDLEQMGITRTLIPTPPETAAPLHILEQLLQIRTTDPVVAKEFAKTAESVHKYAAILSQGALKCEISDPDQFRIFGMAQALDVKDAQAKVVQLEFELLKLANKLFDTPVERARRTLSQVGGGPDLLTIDELIQLYWRRDAALFHVHNPALTPEELLTLHQGIFDYLMQATHLQQLTRRQGLMANIKNAQEKGNTPQVEIDELIKQLVGLATTKRAYHAEDHPEYLVLEYYADILLRKEQVDNLQLLDIRQGKIHHPELLGTALQMIMGAGKTTVLLPLFLLLNADGEHLSIGTLPEALLPSMSEGVAHTLGNFKHAIDVIEFDRNVPLNEKKLKYLIKQFKTSIIQRRALLISSSSLKSLYLKFIEHLHLFAHLPKGEKAKVIEREIELFAEIFRLFKEKGRLLIDEADVIFNAKELHNFVLGVPIPFQPAEARLIGILYEALAEDPRIQALMRFDFTSHNTGEPFDRQTFLDKVVPILSDVLIEQNFGSSDSHIQGYLQSLNQSEWKLIAAYLTENDHEKGYAFVKSIQDTHLKDLLALAKGELLTLLPLTCSKLSQIHYGSIPSTLIAIPYRGSNNPAIKSRFDTYEGAGYTYQYYLKYGIPVDYVTRTTHTLQTQALQELKDFPQKKLEETAAYKAFQILAAHHSKFTLFGPASQAEAIAAAINQKTARKLAVIREFIIPELTNHPLTLSANSQIFNFLFNAVMAFTGTPWNADSFPEGLRMVSENAVTGKTLGLLWKHHAKQVHSVQTPGTSQFAQDLIGKHPQLQHMHVLIDAAGLARGIENVEVIRQLMALPCYQSYQGFVFYDEDNALMILERNGAKPIALSKSSVPLEKRFTFYDQKHTTGADIKNSPNAIAMVTIGKDTILRDLLQAVWRMRGLEQLQRVEFVVDHEVKTIIAARLKEWLGVVVDEQLKLKHLLLFTTYNQALLQGDNNYRAFKHKIHEIPQAEAFAVFLDPTTSKSALRKLFKDMEELFVTKNILIPWKLFGTPQKYETAEIAVKGDVNALISGKAFAAFTRNAILKGRQLAEKIQNRIDHLATNVLAILPANVLKTASILGREMEIEKEVEVEQEKEKEQENETADKAGRLIKRFRFPFDFYGSEHTFDDYAPTTMQQLQEIQTFHQKIFIEAKSAFISLADALRPHADLKRYTDVFDDDLISTLNLQPMITGHDEPYKPFYKYQKPVTDLLIVENGNDHTFEGRPAEFKIAMLDQLDAFELAEIIENQKPATSTVRTCFYNFELGAYRQGPNPIDFAAMSQNPQFIRLLVQAKFFNGETAYTEKETAALTSWIAEKGVDRMYRLFREHILAWKANSRAALPSSAIGKLFKELGVAIK